MTALFVLLIIGSVNGPHKKLHEPELRGEGDALALHLLRFKLVVACGIHQVADLRVIVQLSQESLCPLVSSNLRQP